MISMANLNLPDKAMRQQISSAVDVVIQASRLSDGTRKIMGISEVVGMEGDVVTLQDIFTYDHSLGFDEQGKSRGQLKSMGLRPRFLSKLEEHGVKVDPTVFMTQGFGRR